MPTYFERYQAGEYAQVWKELVALGDGVRQEPLFSDARAVAQETMRRARHNVDLLAGRLKALGFRFCYPNQIVTPPSSEILQQIGDFER